MENELSQLDALIESDVLDALGKNTQEDSKDLTNSDDEISIEDFIEETAQDVVEEDKTEENSIKENLTEDIQESSEELSAPLENETELLKNDETISTNSLAKLLSELLNNKTIEITIKIKD